MTTGNPRARAGRGTTSSSYPNACAGTDDDHIVLTSAHPWVTLKGLYGIRHIVGTKTFEDKFTKLLDKKRRRKDLYDFFLSIDCEQEHDKM